MRNGVEGSLSRRWAGRTDSFAIVLAAGEGRRLQPLTRALYGYPLPKQFASLDENGSLLQQTMWRIRPIIPPSRTVVVVPEEYEELARSQLEPFPGVDVAVQPENKDTAPGVLFPLARIRARNPSASVAVFPSDHYVRNPWPLLRAVRTALQHSHDHPQSLWLLGATPRRPETEYGYILPDGEEGPAGDRRVTAFVEKPAPEQARALIERGALWNTFVFVATVGGLYQAFRTRLPALCAEFEQVYEQQAGSEAALRTLYRRITPSNFSRALLQTLPSLRVIPVEGSGWSDWGTPERVLRALRGRPEVAELRACLKEGLAG